ncbi:hypothetical protein BS50DRAFT_665598 [Corynespora cassiicola Philippines]|uniref:Uncharacterized protein n=1 Tax=Corynespora cassiicola Philippines TaxID=1448308 RepID=A0A2T2NRJ9_CORCC|nr:hypothetical protein BS50DRAFT_665598 [Corynespora cassiicola Philippines]
MEAAERAVAPRGSAWPCLAVVPRSMAAAQQRSSTAAAAGPGRQPTGSWSAWLDAPEASSSSFGRQCRSVHYPADLANLHALLRCAALRRAGAIRGLPCPSVAAAAAAAAPVAGGCALALSDSWSPAREGGQDPSGQAVSSQGLGITISDADGGNRGRGGRSLSMNDHATMPKFPMPSRMQVMPAARSSFAVPSRPAV